MALDEIIDGRPVAVRSERSGGSGCRSREKCDGRSSPIAFVARERLATLDGEDLQVPPIAPTIAVEILSPSDDPRDVASQVDVYLRAGSEIVVVVDSMSRTFVTHDRSRETTFAAGDVFEHAAVPALAIEISAIFAEALDRR